ncbi:phage tail assembly chaperone [Methylobacterium gregans]|uniref:phage tail assembly chaperone n=1 Tax=Methylobacterium gregans TaxID=374424 RepID=UPI001EE28905|nr:phage tail assembly chaperone [Methylobacterium gregans]
MTPTGGSAPGPGSAPWPAFPWDAALALGLGRLGWRPRDFWAATPRELAATLPRPPAALDRGALDRLIAAHPDTSSD